MANCRLMVIKGWFHENGQRFERWLNDSGMWQETQPLQGMRYSQAQRLKENVMVPRTTFMQLVPFLETPAPQLALARPNGRRNPHT